MALDPEPFDDSDHPAPTDGVWHDDWTAIAQPCPECDSTELLTRRLAGNHRSSRVVKHDDGTPTKRLSIVRTDLDALDKLLFAKCIDCDTVLYKHPAAALIDSIDPDTA